MKETDLTALKHVFGLDDVEDHARLRELIEARLAAMNPIDRATIAMRIGTKVEELEARAPGATYSPATRSLFMAGILFSVLAVGATYVVIGTKLWTIPKVIAVLFGVFWLLAGLRAFARVIYRVANKRDW